MNENTNIESFRNITTPLNLKYSLPITEEINNFVIDSRETIKNILRKKDKRLLFVVGPCSIHNIDEAKSYAVFLKKIADAVKDNIFIVMRVYFEKPRTTIGWKGLINDPDLNGMLDVNKGIYLARELLLYINHIGMPCGCEFLDMTTPQYISDLITWGAIGARTTESQVHRELASGLSMPIGFKNNRSGNLQIPCDSVLAAAHSHCFMGINEDGLASLFLTKGNLFCHTILRGSDHGPNYKVPFIREISVCLEKYNIPKNVMIDCSHGNSDKNHKNQKYVLNHTIYNWLDDPTVIMGVMLESNINEGCQKLNTGRPLKYGVSITDSCIGISETEQLIQSVNSLINSSKNKR